MSIQSCSGLTSSTTSTIRTVLRTVVAVATTMVLLRCGVEPVQAAYNVNVNVNVDNVLATMPDTGIGNNISVYDNHMDSSLLPASLVNAGVQLMRYPGGSYSDIYHWSTKTAVASGYVANGSDFGNFTKLLDQTGEQGMVTVNYGSSQQGTMGGQPQEAAAWVAYANADPSIYGTANDIVLGVDAEGNDWKTAGYWAKLRVSTAGEYATWGTQNGVYDAANSFLAINHDSPVGIKYWEIGNEVGGNGYYGYQWEYDLHAPYNNGDTGDNTGRYLNPLLSPTAYANNLIQYATLMKQIDPTIKIGAGLDAPGGSAGNQAVLSTAGDYIDFGIVHLYANNGSSETSLMNSVDSLVGSIQSVKNDFANYTNQGPNDYEIHTTEFGFFGSVPQPCYSAFFDADMFASLFEQGVKSADFWEMSKTPFLGDGATLIPGDGYYATQLMSLFAQTGDDFVGTTSSEDQYLKSHAVVLPDGSVAVLLINERAGDGTYDANVTVAINGMTLDTTGEVYRYGWDEVDADAGLTMSTLTSLGNNFTLSVKDVEMALVMLHAVPGLEGDFDGDNDVDGADFFFSSGNVAVHQTLLVRRIWPTGK